MLSRVGLADLVAESSRGYVETAVRLVSDQLALERLRTNLRDRVAGSPLCDGAGFTRQLEAAYRIMWQEWCATLIGAGVPRAAMPTEAAYQEVSR
jgi:protein O-GlcNAc transferase